MSPTVLVDSKPKRKPKHRKGKARNRLDVPHDHEPVDYYRGPVTKRPFVGYDFKATVIRRERRGRRRRLSIDYVVTAISWQDKGPITEANISIQNPRPGRQLPIQRGHEIMIRWAAADTKTFHPLFRLRVMRVSRSGSAGTMELTLADEAKWLKNTKEDFSYKKGKAKSEGKRPKGWRCDQIARDICRKHNIPLGKIARGRHMIENLTEENISPIAAIQKAYEKDRDETGRKYIINFTNGRLNIYLLRRSKTMLLLGGQQLVEATYEEAFKRSFLTALTVKGTLKGTPAAAAEEPNEDSGGGGGGGGSGSGGGGGTGGGGGGNGGGNPGQGENTNNDADTEKKGAFEIEVRSSKVAMRRYGTIRGTWTIDDPVRSKAKARERARRRLEHVQEPEETLSISVPGVPTLQRGDAMKVRVRELDLDVMVYAKAVSHTVTADDYTMEVECGFTDPFEDDEGEKTREKICKEAKEKKRRLPVFCYDTYDPFAPRRRKKTKKSRQRGDRRGGKIVNR